MKDHIRTKKVKLPSMYLDSKLFHRPCRDDRDTTNIGGHNKSMPDPQFEPLEPDDDASQEVKTSSSGTKKAIELLQGMLKAGAAQESGESWMPMPQKQRKREYDSSFYRDAQPGISGGTTPDLPERGRDWHGTVPGVPDEPGAAGSKIQDQLDHTPANLVDDKPDAKTILSDKNSEAKKALAGAPRFSPGPFVSPPEKEFLKQRGWSDEEIQSGRTMTPRMRAEFNKWLTSTVRKSIGRLSQ